MLEWLKTIFLKQCPPCIVCEENEGELQLSETNWICEKCAQIMNELGNEINN
ncbi:hypothetical protein [Bacillus toyonensis]|uniref:hypothetical protein n=1 Tax=Bacillus toyonensis TaxID=155322 RepID=UPI0015D50BDC|nr:hypothetical protein [Bacillus toyonensis]